MNGPCLLICPGFHSVEMTQQLVQGLKTLPTLSLPFFVYPADAAPGTVLSAFRIRQFLLAQLDWSTVDMGRLPSQPVFFLAFSAGCVGAIAAAHHWHYLGGTVGAFFAVDGWGVPLVAPFPVHRLSHDRFTHDTSRLLGSGHTDFYADPAVPHLELWKRLSQVQGWQVSNSRVGAQAQPRTSPLHLPQPGVEARGQQLATSTQGTLLTAGQFLQTQIETALDQFADPRS